MRRLSEMTAEELKSLIASSEKHIQTLEQMKQDPKYQNAKGGFDIQIESARDDIKLYKSSLAQKQ